MPDKKELLLKCKLQSYAIVKGEHKIGEILKKRCTISMKSRWEFWKTINLHGHNTVSCSEVIRNMKEENADLMKDR
jgi:hypothetical protein